MAKKQKDNAGLKTLGIFAGAGVLAYLGHKYLSVPKVILKSVDKESQTALVQFGNKESEISIAPGSGSVIPGDAGFELRTERSGANLYLRVYRNGNIKKFQNEAISV